MSILSYIFGGWKTWGPNRISGDGANSSGPFSSSAAAWATEVSESAALRIAALHSCLRLRAEVRGTLPVHVRDNKKNILEDHDLTGLLRYSPNSMQTGPEYWSQQNAIRDMHGNALSLIDRRSNKTPIALTPFGSELSQSFTIEEKSRGRFKYRIGGDEYDPEEILHLRGFGMDGLIGLGILAAGRSILQAQISANTAALLAFKQGLKVGGFLKNTGTQDWDETQLKKLKDKFDRHSLPENQSKWMFLLRNMEPVAGEKFTVNPNDAQLLESRYFGIEEICRLTNTPPQLIGHSDKASSWASSLEHINLHFLMYSLTPTLVRDEASVLKRLVGREHWGRIETKWSVAGLLRSDLKSRTEFYASALQNGYHSRAEVRDFEERANIPGGDVFTVQTNLVDITKLPEPGTTPAKQGDKP